MRIGLDVDGVVADFYSAYEKIVLDVSGRDLFGEYRFPKHEPPVWNWPEYFGYTQAEIGRVWEQIAASTDFWYTLKPLWDIGSARTISQGDHDLYWVTARPGHQAKRQTEAWLHKYGFPASTVLLAPDKAAICRALSLDVYVDDRGENVEAIDTDAPATRGYLRDRAYNQHNRVRRRLNDLGGLRTKEAL